MQLLHEKKQTAEYLPMIYYANHIKLQQVKLGGRVRLGFHFEIGNKALIQILDILFP
jgi:hypothetical protein